MIKRLRPVFCFTSASAVPQSRQACNPAALASPQWMQVIEFIPGVWFTDDFKEAVPGEKSNLQTVGREAQGPKAANPNT